MRETLYLFWSGKPLKNFLSVSTFSLSFTVSRCRITSCRLRVFQFIGKRRNFGIEFYRGIEEKIVGKKKKARDL